MLEWLWVISSSEFAVTSKSKSKLLYNWQSVSQYVLVSSTLVGLAIRYYFLPCGLVSVGRPLWREDGSAICSVITQWPESFRTRNYTLLSHLRLPQPGGPDSRIYIPQEQGGPVIPPGTGYPVRCPLGLTSSDSQGYGGGILTLPLHGGTDPCNIAFRNRTVQSSQVNVKVKS
jgi:hypothetical protein